MNYPLSFSSFASRLALGALCLSSFAFNANAALLYWDTSGTAADSTFGGSGSWDTTTANWNTGAVNNAGALQAWTSSFADEARFLANTSGTVTVSGTVQAGGVAFGVRAGDYGTSTTPAIYTVTGGTLDLRASNNGNVIQTWTQAPGTNAVIDSNITLFNGVTTALVQNIRANSGAITINGNIQDISNNSTGNHTLAFESFGGSITMNGNITRSGTSSVQALTFGGGSGTTQSNSAIYTLNGSTSGSGSVAATLARGTLVLNNDGALGIASALSVLNANTTTTGDTARVLIGTGGVSINRAVTFNALTATDTNDIRAIGGQNTSGTATFTNTVTVNAMAASGTGAYTQFTAEAGGRVDFTGSINGTGAIRKVGGGVVAFSSGAANHSGGIVVAEGTLLANGADSTGDSVVTVNSGATLGGNGTALGPITLAAGARMSPGDMAVDNTTSLAGTFNGGSSLTWNSNDTTAGMFFNLGATQGSSDQIALVGAFTKGSGSTFIFDFTGSTLNPSITYTLVTFGSTNFDIDDFSAINGGGGFFAFEGNSLTFAAIPEPSSYAALFGALALAGVALRRRSR